MTATPAPPPPAAPSPEVCERRQRILRYARQAFTAGGYSRARIALIAAEAQVSTATLYQLYPGKSALLSAVIEAAALDLRRAAPATAAGGDGPGAKALALCRQYDAVLRHPAARCLFRLAMDKPSTAQAAALASLVANRRRFEDALAAALGPDRPGPVGNGETGAPEASLLLSVVDASVLLAPLRGSEPAPHVDRLLSRMIPGASAEH